jgi:hypothetical protein
VKCADTKALKNPPIGYRFPMGQIFGGGGFEVYLYAPPREHRPPHVHVECVRGGEVIVKLGDDLTAPSLWQNHHMRAVDAREALRIVENNQAAYLGEWRRLHGS